MIRKLTVVLLSGVFCLVGVTSALAVTYNEAPMLRTLVAAGELPPVEERLPLEPKVVSTEHNDIPAGGLDLEIGQYGGTLRMAQLSPTWDPDIFAMCSESLLSGPGILAEDLRGNVVKDFEVSEDEKVFTFYMRKGLKWSDGVPVTTEDVLFTYEDCLLNKEITPSFPRWMRAGNELNGEPMKLEIIDEYTFRMRFTEPYGGFLAQLSVVFWKGYTVVLKPKHYLKQFHTRYTPLEKLEPLIKEETLTEGDWGSLFNLRDIINWEVTNPRAIGFPTLSPWMLTKVTPTVCTYERNPYYFEVDTEGNQLPYIDRIRSDVVPNMETITMKVLAGEVDFLRTEATLSDLALYKENEKTGGYRTVLLNNFMAPTAIRLNLTHEDPIWRKVVRDVRFRKALSLAINREEIIDAIYFGFAELPENGDSAVPSVYDPAKANQLLDEMGLDKRDAEGYRLGPDGKTFEIPFENATHASDIIPVTELVVEHWKNVGIKATQKTIETALWGVRINANELKADTFFLHGPTLWWGALWDYIPRGWGVLWMTWFDTSGEKGEEPPEEVKKFVDLIYRSIVVSSEEREKVIAEYRRLMYENVWIILPVQNLLQPLIVPNNMGNVPHDCTTMAANFAVEQMFFRQ